MFFCCVVTWTTQPCGTSIAFVDFIQPWAWELALHSSRKVSPFPTTLMSGTFLRAPLTSLLCSVFSSMFIFQFRRADGYQNSGANRGRQVSFYSIGRLSSVAGSPLWHTSVFGTIAISASTSLDRSLYAFCLTSSEYPPRCTSM